MVHIALPLQEEQHAAMRATVAAGNGLTLCVVSILYFASTLH